MILYMSMKLSWSSMICDSMIDGTFVYVLGNNGE